MIVKTKNPIEYQDKNITNIKTRGGYDGEDVGGFISFEGEEFMPFDGQTDLDTFTGADGETYHYSFNNDEYYNAKGEKILGAIKAVGKGIVTGTKAVGKGIGIGAKGIWTGIKFIGGKIKARSKKIADNVKARQDARKVKRGAKKLIAIDKSNAKLKGTAPKMKPEPQDDNISLNAPLPKKPATTTTSEVPKPIAKMPIVPAAMGTTGAPTSADFKIPLSPETADTKPENKVVINGKTYDNEGNKNVEAIKDEKGITIPVLNVPAADVVATIGTDGNVDYYQKKDIEGMTLTTKILIGVGAVAVLGLITFLIIKRKK